MAQGPQLRRRRCQGRAADLREGSEERDDARVRREGESCRCSRRADSRRRRLRARAEPARPDGDGAEGRRAAARGHDGRRSAAVVLAGGTGTQRRVCVGREGSMGERLGQVARLRAVLRGNRPRARASARARRGARAHRGARARRHTDGHHDDRSAPMRPGTTACCQSCPWCT